MATLQELERALIRADAAGDMEAARQLAAAVRAARADSANQIPGAQVPGTIAQSEAPGFLDQVIGAGESALTLATGATGGTIGTIAGAVRGLGESIVYGQYGTQQGAQTVQRNAQAGGQALTYAPRTEAGRAQVGAIGSALEIVPPVVPVVGPIGAMGQSARAAAPMVTQAVKTATTPIVQAANRAAAPVRQVLQRAPAEAQRAGGSIGAQAVAMGDLRQAQANELPIPIPLTKGQRERTFEQQRFEREIAKDPDAGAPIRERMAKQQQLMAQNLDAFVDATGAEATTLREVGIRVNDALRSQVAQAKAKERTLYKAAEKAGEMEAPVSTAPLVQFLKDNESFNTPELSGSSLGLIERELIRLGGATKGPDGLVPSQMTLAQTELVRRQLNKAINANVTNQTNMAAGVQAKQIIDSMTDGVGGDLYKRARAARSQRAKDFENVALVSNLLGTKRGSTDRAIALEDVVRKAIIEPSTSLDQVKHLGGVLLKKTPEGRKAWAELQGATIGYIRDEAYRGVTTDQAGNRVIQPARLNTVINNLDKTGKLDYVLGKKGAEQIRTINDVAQTAFTAPPGAVNTSNTASVLLGAIDMMASAGVGVPLPALSAMRYGMKYRKEKQIEKKVTEALR
jgi:hypothetical protein